MRPPLSIALVHSSVLTLILPVKPHEGVARDGVLLCWLGTGENPAENSLSFIISEMKYVFQAKPKRDKSHKWVELGSKQNGDFIMQHFILSFATKKFHWQVLCVLSSDLFNYHNLEEIEKFITQVH